MECLGCKYSLEGLAVGQCPECGRAFDPADRSSVGPLLVPDVSRWKIVMTTVALGWPMVLILWAFAMLLVARVVLGRWPHMDGGDDPKGINFVSAMHVAWILGALATVPIFAGGLVATGLIAAKRWRIGLLAFGAGIACWFLAIALNRLTGVGIWIMD